MTHSPRIIHDYDASFEPVRQARARTNGRQPGDPDQAAAAVMQVIAAEDPPRHLLLADGVTTGRLRRNVPGVLISALDPERDLYDSTAAWRDRALAGVLHSGTAVSDPRSDDRTRI